MNSVPSIPSGETCERIVVDGIVCEACTRPIKASFWSVLPWIAIFAILVWFFQRAGWSGIDPGRLGSSMLLILGFGVLASISACSAAVMSFLLAWQTRFSQAMTLTSSLVDQAWFQGGRIIGFSLFGGLIGVLGRQLSISVRSTGWLMLILAAVMMWIALDLLGWMPQHVSTLSKKISTAVFTVLGSRRNGPSLALFGALTFFLPCAFTQTIQILALGAGGFFQGAFLLGVFALGSLPALTVIGVIASRSANTSRSWVSYATAALILVFAVFQFQNAWRLTGLPSFVTTPPSALASGMYEGGKYVVRIKVGSTSYEPAQTRVPLGRPVELILDGSSAQGCMRSLVIPAYNIREQLSGENKTIVSFTPTRLGPVTFTCAMGMGDGKIFVVPEQDLTT